MISDSQTKRKRSPQQKSEIGELKDLIQQVIVQNTNLIVDAQTKNNEQFKSIADVVSGIQKQTTINTQENIRMSTLFTSRDRYLFSMGGLISVLMVLVSWVYVSDRTFINKNLDEIRVMVTKAFSDQGAWNDVMSDKVAVLQEKIEKCEVKKGS